MGTNALSFVFNSHALLLDLHLPKTLGLSRLLIDTFASHFRCRPVLVKIVPDRGLGIGAEVSHNVG